MYVAAKTEIDLRLFGMKGLDSLNGKSVIKCYANAIGINSCQPLFGEGRCNQPIVNRNKKIALLRGPRRGQAQRA